jgi:hypothetical protein
MCEEFNGWKNRETWALALWLDNESVWQESIQELAIQALNETPLLDPENRVIVATSKLALSLREWVEDDLLTLGNILNAQVLFNMLTDIGSLYRVDYREIAKGYIEENAFQEE